MNVDLSKYDNSDYYPGAGIIKRLLWYFVNALLFNSPLLPLSRIKCVILRLFGASIGRGVVVKQNVNIKYPWFLSIGEHSWLGEGVWVDNLTWVRIGNHVCISQAAYLLTGNHDYKDSAFRLITGEIYIDDYVWVGARSIVCPGVSMSKGSVLVVASVLSKNALPNSIYRGNPAVWLKVRCETGKPV